MTTSTPNEPVPDTPQKLPPPPAHDGGPALFILTLVVMTVSLGIGYSASLGKASVLGAMVGLFCVMATFGGSLGSDLRRLAWLAPLTVFAACVPRALGNWNSFAGVLVLILVIFGLSLFPAVIPKFRLLGLGVGYAAVAGYGIALPAGTSELHIVMAVLLGLAIAVAVRVLAGISDPTKPTRVAVATPLRTSDFTTVDIIRSWMVDRPSTWTTTVLTESLRFRRAVDLLRAQAARPTTQTPEKLGIAAALTAVTADAAAVADLVEAHHPDGHPHTKQDSADDSSSRPALTDNPTIPDDPRLTPASRALVATAEGHLDTIRQAATNRDTTPLPQVKELRSAFLRARVTAAIRPDSPELHQGLAKAVGILAAWGTGLQVAQPFFANTFFNAVVSMLQPTWTETLRRIGYRLLGCAIAIVLVVLAAVWLPEAMMALIAVIGLFALTWFMFSHPIVSNAGGVAMTVALTATTRHLDPLSTLVHVILMLLVAGVIVLLVSLPSVLRSRRTTVQDALSSANDRLLELLSEIETDDEPDDSTRFGIFVRATEISDQLRGSGAAMAPEQRARVESAADIIDMLTLVTVIYRDRTPTGTAFRDTITRTREILGGPTSRSRALAHDDSTADGVDIRIVRCARELVRLRATAYE
ncbi:FUSC family protein [Gordonia sp. NB41Y]|uniref:FUSC family protein n=1 Tax=Gordonia sp. NB41Y TaxID=875808 RepID=UPI0006B18CAD|nr:FUSC family protein [Gordonia sp. NB41Y]EMP14850.2 hypothetical protein ISGA_296 [Gordonia sp. NB41Y]WLP90765.1 FUSC family protein [Gordonia sp. NB41Y]